MNAAQVQALIRMGLPMAEDIDFRVERLDERHALARIPFHGKLVVCEVGVFSQSNEEDLVAHVTGTYALPL